MPAMTASGEDALIARYFKPIATDAGAFALDDDAAVLKAKGADVVVTTDAIVEGVHFLPNDPPEAIARKGLRVNLSDLAAKGAEPRAYLMALSFPEAPRRDWMAAFAEGLGEAQTAFGMHLVGGDTDRRPGPITISVTVLGEVPTGGMVQRGTAMPGDVLFVTGTLGEAALGLALHKEPALAAHWAVKEAAVRAAIMRYRRPQPRLALRDPLRRYASAAMDLSDGLAKDLGRMCRASGTGATVSIGAVPCDAVARAAVLAHPSRWNDVIAGRDDYEVTSGDILWNGESILDMVVNIRKGVEHFGIITFQPFRPAVVFAVGGMQYIIRVDQFRYYFHIMFVHYFVYHAADIRNVFFSWHVYLL
jgi:thiamine-monophosphate kinase